MGEKSPFGDAARHRYSPRPTDHPTAPPRIGPGKPPGTPSPAPGSPRGNRRPRTHRYILIGKRPLLLLPPLLHAETCGSDTLSDLLRRERGRPAPGPPPTHVVP